MYLSLNGSDWTISGWMRNQWQFDKPMETSGFSMPVIRPIPATVPGSVHTDLRRAGLLEDWNTSVNFLHVEWVEHREWIYKKTFTLPEKLGFRRYFLCFGGLDFHGHIFLNGKQILSFNQMHIPYEIDVTGTLAEGKNQLKIVFLQPPEIDGQVGYTSRTTVLKARFNYGWDWMPRLLNIGIFGDVGLSCTDEVRLGDFYPRSELTGNDGKLEMSVCADSLCEMRVCVAYTVQRDGTICAADKTELVLNKGKNTLAHTLTVPCVQPWYSNGAGGQPLYKVEAALFAEDGRLLDSCEKTVGFRRLEYVRPFGAAGDAYPYALVINGDPVPIKGVNWVPISPFYGSVTEAEYRYYLTQLKRMNVNLLRVWGGALLESETFYRLCDEMGLLIWQEFPQSSSGIDNTPCVEPDFIARLTATAESYVIRRRHHASLAIWCGGNELYQPDYEPTDTRCPTLASLEAVVNRLDPDRLFLPASPSGKSSSFHPENRGKGMHGDTHGPWEYLGETEQYARLDADDSLLQSEVGAAAPPRLETLLRYCKGSLWPPSKENLFWLSRGSWWLCDERMNNLFGEFDGKTKGIKEYVRAFRYLQMEAVRYAAASVRHAGRRKAGLIIWMANEPFPNSANTSILEYDGCPKPAYYKLKTIFAPEMLGLSYASPAVQGKKIAVTLFAGSDRPSALQNVRVKAYDLYGKTLYDEFLGNADVDGSCDIAALVLPAAAPITLVRLSADTATQTLFEEYLFTVDGTSPFGALLDVPRVPVEIRRLSDNRFRLINSGTAAALCLDCIGLDKSGTPLIVENSMRCLLPGESLEVWTQEACTSLTVDPLNSADAAAVSFPEATVTVAVGLEA